ncbi:hypothetical protein [Crateriforma conspicua]|uniref:Chromosome partition protein Smc n=1 Tax=Crateriforma conspicua TaxID=2527996 RepID=A0A5C5Y876_9PLAN|nr:hypothetical protein [Crateriforma conspicua]QDV65286.1 hypothetical protein Mal65_44560 [Crateriforma conspicua]TWT70681.1 hypothetical protein Pan14r_29880 [Crateriforma conspicua]
MSRETAKSIEQLRAEFETLNEQRIKAGTELESANRQLAELQAEAEKEFGTSDIKQLEKMLDEMQTQNEKDRQEYQALLDDIARQLKQVEQDNQSGTPTE